jgi:hypothetical protein
VAPLPLVHFQKELAEEQLHLRQGVRTCVSEIGFT